MTPHPAMRHVGPRPAAHAGHSDRLTWVQRRAGVASPAAVALLTRLWLKKMAHVFAGTVIAPDFSAVMTAWMVAPATTEPSAGRL